jgi:hypothetical protein
MEEPSGDFDEVEEHADDADVKVVVCIAASIHVSVCSQSLVPMVVSLPPSPSIFPRKSRRTYKLLQTIGILTGR